MLVICNIFRQIPFFLCFGISLVSIAKRAWEAFLACGQRPPCDLLTDVLEVLLKLFPSCVPFGEVKITIELPEVLLLVSEVIAEWLWAQELLCKPDLSRAKSDCKTTPRRLESRSQLTVRKACRSVRSDQ